MGITSAAPWTRNVSPVQQQQVIRRYLAGDTLSVIAKDIDRTARTCWGILKRHNVVMRTLSVACRVYSVNDNFFSQITTESQAWLLGFLSADGYIYKNKIQIALCSRDEEILHRIRALLNAESPVLERFNPGQRKPQSIITISSNRLVNDLNSLGVTPRKSLTLKPWNPPQHLARHYFRGLVDGDGWISKNGYEIGLCGTLAVVQAFACYCRELSGSRAQVYRHPKNNVHTFSCGGRLLATQIATELYAGANWFLCRKMALADELIARSVQAKAG